MFPVFSKFLTLKFLTDFKMNYFSSFLKDPCPKTSDWLQNGLCFQSCQRSWFWNFWFIWRKPLFQIFSKILTLKLSINFRINYVSRFLHLALVQNKLCFQFFSQILTLIFSTYFKMNFATSPLEILNVKFSTDYKINFVFIFLQ